MNVIRILSVAAFVMSCASAWGQSGAVEIRHVDAASVTVKFPDEMKGSIKGVVTSSDGRPVAGANVTVTNTNVVTNSFNQASKRDGSYKVVVVNGNCFVDVTAPGYVKQRVELIVASQSTVEQNFVLSPEEGASADGGAARGNKIVCDNTGFRMTVNAAHPAYEGKTLLDAVGDMPAVDLFSEPASVMHSESFEVHVNGNALRVAPDRMRDYFRSIPIGDVRSLKVVSGNRFTKQPASLYIVVDE